MFLKISVLIASVLQVVGAAYLNIGAFENTDRALPVFIQPAGWAFSIWGLIYLLSFVYAVYQVIPKNDNPVLAATRMPALVGFVGSLAWLYFAGMTDWTIWFTIPVLFIMAIAFTYVVRAGDGVNGKQTLLSKEILFPYAAWTGIASWLNIQALLNDQLVVTSEMINYVNNNFVLGGLSYGAIFGLLLIIIGIQTFLFTLMIELTRRLRKDQI